MKKITEGRSINITSAGLDIAARKELWRIIREGSLERDRLSAIEIALGLVDRERRAESLKTEARLLGHRGT
jgi:hypothetical protein